MAKFFGLVKNEYIKNLKKVSTKVMLVLIVLAALGLSAISAYERYSFEMYEEDYDDTSYENYYEDENSWLEESKPEGYETDIKVNNYLDKNGYDPESWQAVLAYKLRWSAPESILFAVLDDSIGGGDWKAACQALLDNAKTEPEKWEYKYRLEHDIPFGGTWKDDVISQVVEAKAELASTGSNSTSRREAEETEKIGLYRLEKNISENTADYMSMFDVYDSDQINFWMVMFQSASLVSVIGLLIIVVAGSSVASEFSQGTIKFLLINPVKRWKILLAKYFTVISLGYIMLAILYLVMIPAAGLMLGFDGISTPYLYVSGGEVHEISSFLQVAKLYLLNSVDIIVMATLAFTLSSLFKSSALAIGVSVFLMFTGSVFVEMLSMMRQDWGRYLIFANTDLARIYSGDSLFPQHSLSFALIVIAVHMLVFILTAWDGFTKREC